MYLPINDPDRVQALLADESITEDSYDTGVILSDIVHGLLDKVVGSPQKIRTDIALWETFLKIAKTEECIPCLDKKKVQFLQIDNEFTVKPAATKREVKRLIELGFPLEEIESLKEACSADLARQKAQARTENRPYVKPPFFPFWWNNQPLQFLKTPLDKTTGDIYSVSLMLPHEVPRMHHKGLFITVLNQLFAELGLSTATKVVVYAYSVTANVKFNFFITFR